MSSLPTPDSQDKYRSKEHYSKPEVFDTYDARRFTSHGGLLFDRLEKRVLMSSLPADKNARILECGAGTGRFSAELARQGYRVLATDVSPGMLEKIRQRVAAEGLAERVTVEYGDIYQLGYSDKSFDFVYSIRVLNQLASNHDKRRAIQEMARLVARDGSLLFDIVNRNSLASLAKASWHITPRRVRRILKESGFEVVRMTGRMIFTQTLLEKLPKPLAGMLNIVDRAVCAVLPFWATRVYFLARRKQIRDNA